MYYENTSMIAASTSTSMIQNMNRRGIGGYDESSSIGSDLSVLFYSMIGISAFLISLCIYFHVNRVHNTEGRVLSTKIYESCWHGSCHDEFASTILLRSGDTVRLNMALIEGSRIKIIETNQVEYLHD